jgi:uncharacterized membrane protein
MKKTLVELWKKISNTKSIMAIVGAVIVILQTMGLKVDAPYINEVATSICGFLVLLGVINKTGMNTKKWNE